MAGMRRVIRRRLLEFRRVVALIKADEPEAQERVKAATLDALTRPTPGLERDAPGRSLARGRAVLRDRILGLRRGGNTLLLLPWVLGRQRARDLRARIEHHLLASGGTSVSVAVSWSGLAATVALASMASLPLAMGQGAESTTRAAFIRSGVVTARAEALHGSISRPFPKDSMSDAADTTRSLTAHTSVGAQDAPAGAHASTGVGRRERIEISRNVEIDLLGHPVYRHRGDGMWITCDPQSKVKTALCAAYDDIERTGILPALHEGRA